MKKTKIRIIRLCSILLVVGFFCSLLGVTKILFKADAASSVKWLGYTTYGTVWDVYDNSKLKIRPEPGNMDVYSGGIANNTTIPIIGYTEEDPNDPWSPWYAIDVPNTTLKEPSDYTVGYVSGQFVKVPVTGINVTSPSKTIKIGTSSNTEYNVIPPCATNKNVSWSSNNSEIATVDDRGVVTSHSSGQAVITVSTEDGNYSASCTYNISPLVSSIVLDKTNIVTGIGDQNEIRATINPYDAFDKSIVWSSNNSSVAEVDQNGIIYSKSVGTATIVATANDGSGVYANCIVTVKPLVSAITLSEESVVVKIGDVTQLTASVLPTDAYNVSVNWSSSDSAIASVDSNGKVTAKASGIAIIKAEANDKSGIYDSCIFNVKPFVSSITLDHTDSFLYVGQKESLNPSVMPENAYDRSVSWSSSDNKLAIVDENGCVTALDDGTVTITATANDGSGVSSSCVYTIEWIPSGIVLSKSKSLLKQGTSETIEALFAPTAVDRDVLWSSSDESVIKVDQNGNVTAISGGHAIVTATLTNGSGQSASCDYTVKNLTTKIDVNPKSLTMVIGQVKQIDYTISPDDVFDSSVTWSSNNTAVALVDQAGHVKAKKAGTAIITVKTNDGSEVVGTCEVVINNPIIWISLDHNYITLKKGDSVELKATVYPDSATNRNLTWKSSNNNVIVVDNKGNITAKNGGNAEITVSANDGSDKFDKCSVNVIVLVERIEFNNNPLIMSTGQSNAFEAKVYPKDATDKTLSWSSSDSRIAVVDDDGTVFVRSGGLVSIRATANDGSCVFSEVTVMADYPRTAWVGNMSQSSYLQIRKDNKANSEIVTKIPYAEKLTVLAPAVEGWYPVKLTDGHRGFACSTYVVFTEPAKFIETNSSPKSQEASSRFPCDGWAGNMKQSSFLNIRKTPKGQVVASVEYASRFTVTGEKENDWYPVTLSTGVKGYASASYVVFIKPTILKKSSSIKDTPEKRIDDMSSDQTVKGVEDGAKKTSIYPLIAWVGNMKTSGSLKIFKTIAEANKNVYGPNQLGSIKYGTALIVTGPIQDGYYPVTLNNGNKGFANASFIVFKQPATAYIVNACQHKNVKTKIKMTADFSDFTAYIYCKDCGRDVTNEICKHENCERIWGLLPNEDSTNVFVLWRCKDCGMNVSERYEWSLDFLEGISNAAKGNAAKKAAIKEANKKH